MRRVNVCKHKVVMVFVIFCALQLKSCLLLHLDGTSPVAEDIGRQVSLHMFSVGGVDDIVQRPRASHLLVLSTFYSQMLFCFVVQGVSRSQHIVFLERPGTGRY